MKMGTTFPLLPALKMKHIREQGCRAKAAVTGSLIAERLFFVVVVKYGIANPKAPCALALHT